MNEFIKKECYLYRFEKYVTQFVVRKFSKITQYTSQTLFPGLSLNNEW